MLTAAADAAITSGIEQTTDTTLAMADYRGPTAALIERPAAQVHAVGGEQVEHHI